MIISGMEEKEKGIECVNPRLRKVQKGNLMPMNARSCPLYKPVNKGKSSKKGQ